MNVYDFDKTVYRKDCSCAFYLWCLRRQSWAVVKHWPQLVGALIRYRRGRIARPRLMEYVFSYLPDIRELEREVERFWDAQAGRVSRWYLRQQREDDLVISASPAFLVEAGAHSMGIARAMGSPLNAKTGRYEGERCHGRGKVNAFRAEYPEGQVDEFYSDSLSDAPMAAEARRAFLVKGETLLPWPENSLKKYIK